MAYGFVRVAASSPDLRVADVEYNVGQIKNKIAELAEKRVSVMVFPELCICGYTCGDLFFQPTLLSACEKGLAEIAECTKGISALVFVGLPFRHGGKLYNVAAAVSNGRLLAFIPKTHLPSYNEFYERRYFVPAADRTEYIEYVDEDVDEDVDGPDMLFGEDVVFGTKVIFASPDDKDFTVACEICEDLWAPSSPGEKHAGNGASIIVNLSASDETIGKAEYRRTIINAASGKNVCGYVYADAGVGESTTDMIFAGHNIISENGSILAESKPFSGEDAISEIDVGKLSTERRKLTTFPSASDRDYIVLPFKSYTEEDDLMRTFSRTPFVPHEKDELNERAQLILSMQANALAKRLKHTNAKTAVIGVSGGLDSTLALLVTCRAFDIIGKDRKDIVAITMPGFGTTEKTKGNSLKLMEELGVSGKTVSITDSVRSHFKDIGQSEENKDVTYENSQARMRTMILMDTANKTGGLVIGTGDLSELALGWCTYNGDHMSMYAVNSGVPKTLVKHLVRSEGERIGGAAALTLDDILNTEISPELLPPDKDGHIAQKTEDIIGPYELHDFYLYYAIRWGYPPEKIYYIAKQTFKGAYDKKTLKKWLKNFYKRFFSQQFKRSCLPDGVKIGSVTLSPRADWRMPSDAAANLWLKEVEEL